MRNLWGGRRGATWMAGVAGAVVLLVGTSGCAAEPAPAPTSSASSSPTPAAPVFASDEEALAAATEAYANYLATYDAAWSGDDTSMDAYLALSTGSARQEELESKKEWDAKGWRAIGTTSFDSMQLVDLELEGGVQTVRTYVCLDVSKGDVVDASGASVAKADRPLRIPLEVDFQAPTPDADDIKVSRSEVWSGRNFC